MTTATPATSPAPTESFTFASEVDGASIFVRKWVPPCGIRPRAAVQTTHGISEYSGRYDRLARFLAAQACVVYALDLSGHGQTAGVDRLGQGGPNVWDEMTADLKQLAQIARTENLGVSLIAFGHSMGSALTQAHIKKHGELLAGAILCGRMGAIPGLYDNQFESVIQHLHVLATGPGADMPSTFFGSLLANFNAPFIANVAHPTGCEWQTSDPEEIRKFLKSLRRLDPPPVYTRFVEGPRALIPRSSSVSDLEK